SSGATPTFGTLYNSDGVTGLSQAFASRHVLGVGGSTLEVTGYTVNDDNGGNDYAVTTHTASGTVTPLAITGSITVANKVYDGGTAAGVALTDNRVGSDVFADAYVSASFANKNVGDGKAVAVSGISISGTDAGNYALTSTTATTTANVTPALLIISAVGD